MGLSDKIAIVIAILAIIINIITIIMNHYYDNGCHLFKHKKSHKTIKYKK